MNVRLDLDRHFIAKDGYIKAMIEEAKHIFWKEIKNTIRVDVDEFSETVTAALNLPVIKDKLVNDMEKEIESKRRDINRLSEQVKERNLRIVKFNNLPWYKRIFKKV